MPRQQPNDNQQRVIMRNKTRTIGTPKPRVEQSAASPERRMARDESGGGDRSVVAPSRRPAGEAPPLRAGDVAPPVPAASRKGHAFPERIAVLEERSDVLEERSDVLEERSDVLEERSDVLDERLDLVVIAQDELRRLAEEAKLFDTLRELVEFKTDVTTALQEYAGRVGALEGAQSVLLAVLEKHGITLEEPPAATPSPTDRAPGPDDKPQGTEPTT